MTDQHLIILHAASALEDNIADCLLALESAHGFNCFPLNLYHHENKALSLTEQVTGRQKQICFQIHTDGQGLDFLLSRLRDEFKGAGIRYWVVPLTQSGII